MSNVKVNRLLALIIVLALVSASVLPYLVKANSLDFIVQNNGSCGVSATTTLAFMTAGAATTTSNVYDTYCNGNAQYATDNLALEVQLTASSTGTGLGWFYEYAQGNATANCVNAPTSCDWYVDNTNPEATTTPVVNVTTGVNYKWTFASTTQGGGLAPVGNNTANKMFTVQPVARYVRAVFYLVPGSTNGAVWAAFIGQKQKPQ